MALSPKLVPCWLESHGLGQCGTSSCDSRGFSHHALCLLIGWIWPLVGVVSAPPHRGKGFYAHNNMQAAPFLRETTAVTATGLLLVQVVMLLLLNSRKHTSCHDWTTERAMLPIAFQVVCFIALVSSCFVPAMGHRV